MKVIDARNRLSLKSHDDVALTNPGARRGAVALDLRDQHAPFARQFMKTHDAGMKGHILSGHADGAAADPAVLNQPAGDKLRRIAANGEADALRRQDDRRVDADDFADAIDQRASGVAGIERGIGLNDIVHQTPGFGTHGSTQGADDSGSHRLLKPIGRADGDRDLTDAECPPSFARPNVLELRRVDADDGQVSVWIFADQFGREASCIV